MEFFDFIDSLFSKKLYEKVDNQTKQKYFFIMNRFLSNAYPVHVNDVNNISGISKHNSVYLVDHWARFLHSRYTSKPQWAWVKTTPISAPKSTLSKFSDEIISEFRQVTGLTSKDIKSISAFFLDDLVAEVTEFERVKKIYERKNPKKKN